MIRVSTRIGSGCRAVRLPLLEDAQQLDLDLERQVANLVEENRRLVGQLEASDLPRQGAGERPLLATEQLALEERGGNRRAVHAHHRPFAPPAQLVNFGGEQLLTGPGFAEQQHGGIGGRHLPDLLHDLADGGALSDDGVAAQPLPGLGPEVHVFGL